MKISRERSHLSTTVSTPRFPTTAHFSCPSALKRKIKEHTPAKLSFISSPSAKIADKPFLGREYVSMVTRENDSGQLKRYSLGNECESPVVLTSNALLRPKSYVNDAQVRRGGLLASSFLRSFVFIFCVVISLSVVLHPHSYLTCDTFSQENWIQFIALKNASS